MIQNKHGKLLILNHTFKNKESKLLSILIDNDRLEHVQAESGNDIGSIYIGKVNNISTAIGACFVETTPGELCFLPLAEINDTFHICMLNRPYDGSVHAGDEILVQIVKEAMKTKLPSVTTKISFSGKYVVLSAGQKHLGMSGKIPDPRKRELLNLLQENNLVNDKKLCVTEENDSISYGFVVRTNAAGLLDDSFLLQEWKELEEKWQRLLKTAHMRTCYSCLYKEAPTYIKNIRDIYDNSYDEIVTDIPQIYKNLQEYLATHGQDKKLRFYDDEQISLAKLYGIPSKLDSALGSRVWLKSGGYLVIEPTEALTVIDVNSGKYESKKIAPSGMALKINTEAAYEIAHQLKLRNLSGIIIVDFINMKKNDNLEIMRLLKKLCNQDSVPTDVIDMTPLGLVEITRKKINKTLKEQLNQ